MSQIDRDRPTVKARMLLHDAIRDAVLTDPPEVDDGEGFVVKGWVCVMDVIVGGNEGRMMYVLSSDAIGEGDLVRWERDGLLHYALYSLGRDSDDDDSPDDEA